jgi:hypothetical protein
MQSTHFESSLNLDLFGSDAIQTITDTDKLFQLRPITCPPGSHIMIALRSFNMIYSKYLIREGINDLLTITMTSVEAGTVSLDITISKGSYDIVSLIFAINTQISLNIAELNMESLALSFDDVLHCLTFTGAYDNENYTLTEMTFESTAYIQLGLLEGVASSFSTSSGTFPKIYSCMDDSVLYIRLPNLSMVNQNSKNVSSVIAAIPINVGFGDSIYHEVHEPIYSRIYNPFLTNLQVQILDQDMQPYGNLLTNSTFRISLLIHFNYNHELFISDNKLLDVNIHKQNKQNAETKNRLHSTR